MILSGAVFDLIGLEQFLILSAVLFVLGLYTILTRKNAVAVLMGIELILNSASINFIAFSRYSKVPVNGDVMAIFIIVLAAAEAVLAFAIFLGIFQQFKTIDVDETDTLKG